MSEKPGQTPVPGQAPTSDHTSTAARARPGSLTSMADLPLRADLRGLSPYGAPQIDVPVRLNTNENPHPPPPELVEDLAVAVRRAATTLNRYPDREAEGLREDLAAYLHRRTGVELSTRQVWAANGSNEVLQQILQAFGGPGRTALGFEPSYSMHRLISLGTATSWVSAERRGDHTLDAALVADTIAAVAPDVVFLCSPNNPTGTALSLDAVSAACRASLDDDGTPTAVVVVDEAYAEFARAGTRSALHLLGEYPHLMVTRTMSKAFALAGARVGYLGAGENVVDALHLVRLPYHLSALTQSAARAALAHADEVLRTVDAVIVERERIVAALPALGLRSVPSDANFVLVGEFPDAHATWQALLDRGVLVRDVGVPGWLRITAGLPHETDALLGALESVVASSA